MKGKHLLAIAGIAVGAVLALGAASLSFAQIPNPVDTTITDDGAILVDTDGDGVFETTVQAGSNTPAGTTNEPASPSSPDVTLAEPPGGGVVEIFVAAPEEGQAPAQATVESTAPEATSDTTASAVTASPPQSEVEGVSASLTAPSTGDGGLLDRSSSYDDTLLGLGILVIAAGLGGIGLARRGPVRS